jgi:adenylate cyclase
VKLRHRIAALVVLTQTVLVTALTLHSANTERTRAYEEMSGYARMMAKVFAGRWISQLMEHQAFDRSEAEQFMGVMMALDARIAGVVVARQDGTVLAGVVNPKWVAAEGARDAALAGLLRMEVGEQGYKAVSIALDRGGTEFGRIKIVFSLAGLRHEILRATLVWVGLGAVFVGVGVAGAFAIAARVTRPLEVVVGAMGRVEQGDLTQQVQLKSRDEIGAAARSFNKMVEGLRERQFIQDTFSRYVSRQVAEKILRDRGELKLRGEKRTVTVLFADIRGFTPFVQKLDPEKVFEMLNEYFSVMVDVVFKYGGLLDKYIGDAIMVVYNVPLDQRYHELRAVLTGLEIQERIITLNERRRAKNEPAISAGIGINTAEVVAGSLGSAERLEYTVIGAGVNLAQRIESQTERGKLFISENTWQAVKAHVEAVKLDAVKVKGIDEPVPIYWVLKATVPEDFNEIG